jgi:glycosyltransferase involved in cell wall biosynthesis
LSDVQHIAFVTETFAPEINGVAMTLGRLVDGLLGRGYRVNIFRPRQSREEQPRINGHFAEHLFPGMQVPMYRELRFGFPAGRRLFYNWRQHRPDAVYIATEGPLGWSAVNTAHKLGLPTLSGFHTNFHTYSRHYRLSLLEPLILGYLRKLHRRTGCTLVPTASLAAQLREQAFGCVEVLQRGVDTALFNPGRRDEALRREWGVEPDQLVCLYVGRIAAEKNIHTTVKAFRAIQQHTPDARLVLVGDGPLRTSLAGDNPDFVFCGMRRGEDLARHYAGGDLFLFPSRTETFGNVVTEAMASGLAVSAYNLAAAGEHIRDGETGALVLHDDEAAFVERSVALSLDRARLRQIGHDAAAHAAALGWDGIVNQFIQLLDQQIRGKP